MASDGADLRRSERTTKGKLPSHLDGYEVDYPGGRREPGTSQGLSASTPRIGAGRGRKVSQAQDQRVQCENPLGVPAVKKSGSSGASVKSMKSQQSTRSQVSDVVKMKIALESDEKIAEIQEKIDDIEYEERLEEQKIDRLRKRHEALRQHVEISREATPEQINGLQTLQEYLEDEEQEFIYNSEARHHKLKKLRTQRDLLYRKKEVRIKEAELDDVEEEDEDDVVSTPDQDDIDAEKRRATEDWAKQASQHPMDLAKEEVKSSPTRPDDLLDKCDDDHMKLFASKPVALDFQTESKATTQSFRVSWNEKDRQLQEISLQEKLLENRKKKLLEDMKAAEASRRERASQLLPPNFKNPRPPPGYPTMGQNYQQQPSGASAGPAASPIEDIARVFQQAFQLSQQGTSKNTTETAKFVARTAMAKDLPDFNGKPEDWIKFKSAYDATTDACKFSALENLTRLQKCLKGEALRSVESMLISPDNVAEVLATLERNFGRPQNIIRALVRKAESLGPVKEHRVESIIEFGTAVANITATIAALKKDEYLQNPLLRDKLEEKLSPGLLMLWGRWAKQKGATKTLSIFSEWIKEEADTAREVCHLSSESISDDHKRDNSKRKKEVFVASQQGFEPKKEPVRKCICCSKPGHKLPKCEDFSTLSSNDRWKFIRDKKLCICCLNYGHAAKDCRSKRRCEATGCEKMHHSLLHSVKVEENKPAGGNNQSNRSVEESAVAAAHQLPREQSFVVNKRCESVEDTQVNLLILPVKLRGPKGTLETFAMLDGGSTTTFLREDIANELGLSGVNYNLRIQDLQHESQIPSSIVSLDILPADEKKAFNLKNVRTIPRLPLPYQSVRRSTLKKWKHLQGINLVPYEGGQPTILIGQDNSNLTMPYDRRKGPSNSPMAVLTELGWVLTGKNCNDPRDEVQFNFHCYAQAQADEEIHEMVKRYFSLESFGVKVSNDKPRSREDKRAQDIMDATIKRVSENRWETGLLWRYDHVKFPNSEPAALKRLTSLERKMDSNEEFGRQYCQKIEEYVAKGYAQRIQDSLPRPDNFFVVPHFPVRNPKKPNKPFRLVFDAASKAKGVSLNDNLIEGPDKLIPLPDILMKFRQKAVAVTADIAEMFHQVRIRDEDLPSQRFLFRGMERDRPPDLYQMAVMIFGATCSPSCAQEVKNKNAQEFSEQFPQAAKSIVEKHYVDDYLESFETVEEAQKITAEIIEVHAKGGFTIRSWIASNPDALTHVPEELLAAKQLNFNLNRESEDAERVLGLYWQPALDMFTFKTDFCRVRKQVIDGDDIPTKREALSLIMSVFDPLGFLAHFMVKAKIMLQETWRHQIGWDDPIPPILFKIWRTWLLELHKIKEFSIPRCYSLELSRSPDIQLHVFVDASDQAYASVAYFRFRAEDGWQTAFVMARTRVAPLKPLSIVRMELQAALMGSRLAKTISEAHEIKVGRVYFWTDNRTVLYWVKSESRRFQVFVGQRIGEIQELTNPVEWRWIPTKENVADEATRAESQSDWSKESRWLKGPNFLLQEDEDWPEWTEPESAVEEDELELRKKHVNLALEKTVLIDPERFSRYWRMIRSTAWLFRYMNNLRPKNHARKSGELDVAEIQKAENWWFRQAQQDKFKEDLKVLRSEDAKKAQVSKKSMLYKLCPQLDSQGVMRVAGRLSMTEICPLDTRSPIILPRGHRFTELLLQHLHELNLHHGQEHLVNTVRQRFYIPALRTEVRRCFLRCQACKVRKAKPRIPEMGPLPECRLTANQRPFTMTGLDYFGPMGVTVGRSHQKRYGCLFTCMTTRAVHLEIAHSLDTDSCIMAIRRFAARRGDPSCIFSDNGTNFVGADRELRDAIQGFDQDQLKTTMSKQGIDWIFNPPSAPHMGGSWERLVRSVKTALKAILKEKFPKDEVLQTLFAEAERQVNGHPLTYVSTDVDAEPALTPYHFLIGTPDAGQPIGQFCDKDLLLRKQWRQSMRLSEHFWKRWLREFLPTIVRRQKWHETVKNAQVGDMGLLMDDLMPREEWPLGRITAVYPGVDGVVRRVDIKTSKGTYHRPVHKVCVFGQNGLGQGIPKPGGSVSAPQTHVIPNESLEETESTEKRLATSATRGDGKKGTMAS